MTHKISAAAAALALVFCLAGCAPKAETQISSIPGERGEIPATLTVPEGESDFPAVVLCHGFTGERGLDGHAEVLAKDLADNGIATLSIEFAGHGDSTEPFTAYTPSSMESDIRSAVRYLVEDCGADPDRIGILGHSMGGRAAALALDDTFRAAALWAPAAGKGLDGLEFIDHDPAVRQALFDASEGGTVVLPRYELTVTRQFMEEMAESDPCESIKNYTGALLVVFSGADVKLFSQQTIDRTLDAARSRGLPFTDLTPEFGDATHNLTGPSDDTDADKAIRSRIDSATVAFFAENL